MSFFWSIYKNHEWPEYYLFVSIIIFILTSLLFLILLFVRRLKTIHEKKLVSAYIPIIHEILFTLLFKNDPIHKVIDSKNYTTFSKYKTFKRVLLQNLIKLHLSYLGDYNLKLEEFYYESGLIKISLRKLQSRSWSIRCEGIRELSQMNVKEATYDIHKCIWDKNDTLKLEALLGIMRLKGLEGLTILTDYDEHINDWIQLNILCQINTFNLTTVKDFSDFLRSKNESVVILGLRLIAGFNQIQNIDKVRELQASNSSDRIKDQAGKTHAKLTNFRYL